MYHVFAEYACLRCDVFDVCREKLKVVSFRGEFVFSADRFRA